jgi:hypothetical protein
MAEDDEDAPVPLGVLAAIARRRDVVTLLGNEWKLAMALRQHGVDVAGLAPYEPAGTRHSPGSVMLSGWLRVLLDSKTVDRLARVVAWVVAGLSYGMGLAGRRPWWPAGVPTPRDVWVRRRALLTLRTAANAEPPTAPDVPWSDRAFDVRMCPMEWSSRERLEDWLDHTVPVLLNQAGEEYDARERAGTEAGHEEPRVRAPADPLSALGRRKPDVLASLTPRQQKLLPHMQLPDSELVKRLGYPNEGAAHSARQRLRHKLVAGGIPVARRDRRG